MKRKKELQQRMKVVMNSNTIREIIFNLCKYHAPVVYIIVYYYVFFYNKMIILYC